MTSVSNTGFRADAGVLAARSIRVRGIPAHDETMPLFMSLCHGENRQRIVNKKK
jgi:hypothetical protein